MCSSMWGRRAIVWIEREREREREPEGRRGVSADALR